MTRLLGPDKRRELLETFCIEVRDVQTRAGTPVEHQVWLSNFLDFDDFTSVYLNIGRGRIGALELDETGEQILFRHSHSDEGPYLTYEENLFAVPADW
jgi:hypothetical protein